MDLVGRECADAARDTRGPGRDGFRVTLEAAGAQSGPKGLRDVMLLRLLHDLGVRRSEAVRLDVKDVDLQRNWILSPARGARRGSWRTCPSRPGPPSPPGSRPAGPNPARCSSISTGPAKGTV